MAGKRDDAPTLPGAPPDDAELAKHITSIRRYLAKILRRDEIEDGVQEVLQRVLENRDRFRGDSSTRVWILGIARNVGLEMARNRTRLPKLSEHPSEGGTTGDVVPEWQEPTQEEMLGR